MFVGNPPRVLRGPFGVCNVPSHSIDRAKQEALPAAPSSSLGPHVAKPPQAHDAPPQAPCEAAPGSTRQLVCFCLGFAAALLVAAVVGVVYANGHKLHVPIAVTLADSAALQRGASHRASEGVPSVSNAGEARNDSVKGEDDDDDDATAANETEDFTDAMLHGLANTSGAGMCC